jgi:hypothetical protein
MGLWQGSSMEWHKASKWLEILFAPVNPIARRSVYPGKSLEGKRHCICEFVE